MTEVGLQGIDCAPAHIEFQKYNRIPVEIVTKGSTKLQTGFKVPIGTYWLGSDTIMQDAFSPDGEIVDVVSNRYGYTYLKRPIQRTWHGPGLLIQAPIRKNVVLDGGAGPLSCCLIDGLVIRNWKIDGYKEARGISIQSCRNVTVEDCSISNPAETTSGKGYGVQIQRCTNFTVSRVTGMSTRHTVTVFGSATGLVQSCTHNDGKGGGFDTHGFGEEHVTFDNCDFGGTDFSVGNRFLWGSKYVTASQCKNVRDVFLYGATEDTWLEMMEAWMLRCFTNEAGSPISCTTLSCKFGEVIYENGSIQRLTHLNPVPPPV